jgi:Leucine-rich repeat (LRR) protein
LYIFEIQTSYYEKAFPLLLALITFTTIQAQIINIPDANFKARLLAANTTNYIASTDTPNINGVVNTYTQIDTNNDGEIEVNEALAIKWIDVSGSYIIDLTGIESFTNLQYLDCPYNYIQSLNLSGLTNLQYLKCTSNQLSSLNVSNLINLQTLDCSDNQLSSLNVSNLTNLQTLDCSNNQLPSLDLSGLTLLQYLYCISNQLPSLNVSNLTNLLTLECSNNQLPSLNVSGLINLQGLGCSNNQLPSLNVSGLINLQTLDCSINQLPSLDVSGLTNLVNLQCGNNQLPSLDLSGLTLLQYLYCSNNQLSILNVSSLSNLQSLYCDSNQLTSLDLTGLTNFSYLSCRANQINNLNITGLTHLSFLHCGGNQLSSLNLSGFMELEDLDCSTNQLTSLNIGGLTSLQTLYCSSNQLTSIDVSSCPALSMFDCANSPVLTNINIKNGRLVVWYYTANTTSWFYNCPNLQYICADDDKVVFLNNYISQLGYTNCHVNSYCSFVPGGAFYTIQGNNRYDEDNNGCSPTDINYPNLKLSFTDGTNTGNLIPDATGTYHYDMQAGTQTVTPTLENPAYFMVSPTSATVNFPTATSPSIQDFCITANGSHNDLEVTILPIGNARPGFDAHYQIIYKNKGTATQSGTVGLTYDSSVSSYVSAIPTVTSQATNNLSWSFSNLLPFETREIGVTLNINSPTATPPVNLGDVLNYKATVAGLTDETPNDNTSSLNQTVVNALDPNDKTCVEGTTVSPSMVGQYVHYIIHFENDGTANAQNIVVKDMIDTTKFDVSSLVPLIGSANFTTRITNTNQVEFIFQNINLPFAAGTNGGYVAFKIKTLPSLVVGDTFSNTANIYFDYNYPIVTNTATTTIAALATQDFDFGTYFSVYPIPAKQVLNLETKATITVKSISVYNMLGQVVTIIPNAESVSSIDVSNLKTGTYFIKVNSDKGTANMKFIKE